VPLIEDQCNNFLGKGFTGLKNNATREKKIVVFCWILHKMHEVGGVSHMMIMKSCTCNRPPQPRC